MIIEAVDMRPKIESEKKDQCHILKFKGSIVENAQTVEVIVNVLNDSQISEGRVVLVVSAIDGVEGQLMKVCDILQEKRSERDLLETVDNIKARHMEVVSELSLSEDARNCLEKQVGFLFFCMGEDIAFCDGLTSEKREKILDYGSKFAARIVATKMERVKGVKVVDEASFLQSA